jgi:hypothetical protein
MRMPLGSGGRQTLAQLPPPDRVQGTDAKGLTKACGFVRTMAEAKWVDAHPSERRGRLLPNDVAMLADLDRLRKPRSVSLIGRTPGGTRPAAPSPVMLRAA